MFQVHGWKSFALTQGLPDGHVLHLKFDGAAMLFVKAFESVGGRLDYYMEGESSSSCSPSGTDDNGSSSFSGGGSGDNDSDGSPGAHV
ncbi:hypothetical protein D1007_45572 [Hordeum vulgare]|nr:hypothetical protein D1007_45572 [Hordeum vulgare]